MPFEQPSRGHFESAIRPHLYIVLPNEFDHELYYNRDFSLYMKLCPQGIEQRGAWGWSLAKIDVKITTPNSYFSKF